MSKRTAIRSLALLLPTVFAAGETVFLEQGGKVTIEAESTDSRLGKWKKKTDVADYQGECHLEFTGNKTESGPADSPLGYHFKINKPGTYQLILRARKRLESKREDISNDCYIALKGDFEAGGEAPLKILRSDTKMFGGDPKGWGWATQIDVNHIKYPVLYRLKQGETYELTISGRSKNFNIDRILLFHEDHDLREIQRENPPESRRDSDGAKGSRLAPVTVRKLTNAEGKVIEAQLIGKDGDTLIVMVSGRRYEIPISTLSKSDRAFVKGWQP
ncbi:hypothetical protein HZ994_11455 [Akkermansiaceae bacterium]|nr:hypothetical protein HZ994_11455 [Akkermansiaceae bacterium]